MPEFVEGVRPDERVSLSVALRERPSEAQVGHAVTFQAAVRNDGPEAWDRVVVALLVDAKQVRTATVDVPPYAVALAELSWTPAEVGRHLATAVLDPAHRLVLTSRDTAADTITVDVADAVEVTATTDVLAAAAVGQWTSIGPDLITEGLGAVGRLHHVVIDPGRPDTMFVASGGNGGSGVWKTTNGGGSWRPVTNALGTPNVRALAMDPANSSRLFAATLDGLITTTDGGTSWTSLAGNSAVGVSNADETLIVDPDDPDRLYLTTPAGVKVSADGGRRWSVVLAEGPATDLVLDRTVPGRMYAAVSKVNAPAVTGVYESVDRGGTWRRLTGCPGGRLPTPAAKTTVRLAISGSRLFASFKTDTDWTLYRTSGVGCSIGGRPESVWERGWRPEGSIGSDPIFKRLWKFIAVDPTNPDFVYAGGTDLWMSTDRGDSFTRTTEPHVDHQGFAIRPTDTRTIYTVCDGGIYRSTARGTAGSWSFIGEGIRNVEFYDIASPPANPDMVFGGTQDNGTIRYDAPSTTWAWKRGGDGATVAADPVDENVLYSMGQYAPSIERSTDGGDHWTAISRSLPDDDECYNLHYQTHPTDQKIVLASCKSLWRLRLPGTTWSSILTVSGAGVVRSAVDPATDLYYAGTNTGALHAGAGGAGFRQVVLNPTGQRVNDIEIDPDDQATVYVAFGGGSTGRVVRVRRAGTAPFTFTDEDITATLPTGLVAKTIGVDRMNARTIYLGTQRGVYRGVASTAGLWTWSRYGNGLPDPDVRALHVHPRTGVLRAGTFGRGAYEVHTGPPLGSVLTATGRITFIRAHDVGSGYGSGTEHLDAEAIVKLNTLPQHAFGLQLRGTTGWRAAKGMFDQLRTAYRRDVPVRIDYTRTGFRSGLILRVTRP